VATGWARQNSQTVLQFCVCYFILYFMNEMRMGVEVFRHPKRENMIENALTLQWEKLSVKSLKCGLPISQRK
jgi:hypothetical protein